MPGIQLRIQRPAEGASRRCTPNTTLDSATPQAKGHVRRERGRRIIPQSRQEREGGFRRMEGGLEGFRRVEELLGAFS